MALGSFLSARFLPSRRNLSLRLTSSSPAFRRASMKESRSSAHALPSLSSLSLEYSASMSIPRLSASFPHSSDLSWLPMS